jgi:hypothetical protein
VEEIEGGALCDRGREERGVTSPGDEEDFVAGRDFGEGVWRADAVV